MGETLSPEQFHLRCPSCSKLYVVASADIANEMPEFDCVSCHERFFFHYPPTDFRQIETVLVSEVFKKNDAISQEMRAQGFQEEAVATKNCPKCGSVNAKNNEECTSCRVIFAKLEGLPSDPTLNAQPSLVRKWKELVLDFENEAKHDDFIQSCRQMNAVKYAENQYQEMLSAMGQDEACERMLKKIRVTNSVMATQASASVTVPKLSQKAVSMATLKGAPKSAATVRPHWMKYLFIGPFTLSALMILVGMFNLNHRNMIGGGMALGFCAAGLIMMVKGRLSYEDFK